MKLQKLIQLQTPEKKHFCSNMCYCLCMSIIVPVTYFYLCLGMNLLHFWMLSTIKLATGFQLYRKDFSLRVKAFLYCSPHSSLILSVD